MPIPHVNGRIKQRFLVDSLFDKFNQVGDLGSVDHRFLVAEAFRKDKTIDLFGAFAQYLILAAFVIRFPETDGQRIDLRVFKHGFGRETVFPIPAFNCTEPFEDLPDNADVIYLFIQAAQIVQLLDDLHPAVMAALAVRYADGVG